ncbi:MAG TPA: DUF4893 domain-containing protein [Allosphingosinicella sp.]|jgi:hypothetical protein|uniref:DUF4893 domain-containing protein n=1 Tax=Allosphingosinicella sp. TaxID=2823234 RepID=UPI002F2948CD
MRLAALPLLLVAALAACGSRNVQAETRSARAPIPAPDWRAIATPDDRERLRGWRTAWIEGVRKAQANGHGAVIAREGALLDPDAAIDWRNPPPGDYRCRVIKVGAKTRGMLDYVAYPAFTCRIRQEGALMSFAKMTGSQRPLGHFLPYVGQRMVFLGTLQLGDEPRALQYGRDRERDMAGVVERIGEHRWRLVLPYPHFESTIDIVELLPADTRA